MAPVVWIIPPPELILLVSNEGVCKVCGPQITAVLYGYDVDPSNSRSMGGLQCCLIQFRLEKKT